MLALDGVRLILAKHGNKDFSTFVFLQFRLKYLSVIHHETLQCSYDVLVHKHDSIFQKGSDGMR